MQSSIKPEFSYAADGTAEEAAEKVRNAHASLTKVRSAGQI